MVVEVRFEPEGVTVAVPAGATVREAAAAAGLAISAPCGGQGRCGGCRVRAAGGLRPPARTESDALGASVARGVRLACLARVAGPEPVVVERIAVPGRIRALVEGAPADFVIEPIAARGLTCAQGTRALGAAVDLGTTTIAVRVHDLTSGAVLAETGVENPQTRWGADVLSRVSRALDGEADALRAGAAEAIERAVTGLLDTPALADGTLCEVVIVGNPAMTLLLLGRDPAPLAGADGAGADVSAADTDAAGAGMPLLGGARIHVAGGVSAFVGGDAVAAALATGIASHDDGAAVVLDLGTNGEVLLAVPGRGVWAASAAAGPAFEGAGTSSGMRAEPGAIERVWLRDDGTLGFDVIGGGEPRGLCGSGSLDALGVMLETGALDGDGRMHPRGPLASAIVEEDGVRELRLAPGVALTQLDVRALQLAKAAVEVALDCLLERADIDPDQVREVFVAGGFGASARPSALVRLGVIPAAWAERVTYAGNAALAGASAMLLATAARHEAEGLAASARTVPLASRPDFQARFLAAVGFPGA